MNPIIHLGIEQSRSLGQFLIVLALAFGPLCRASQYLNKPGDFTVLAGREAVHVNEKNGRVTLTTAGKSRSFSFATNPGWFIYDDSSPVLWAYDGKRGITRLTLKPNVIESKVCPEASDFWKILPYEEILREISFNFFTDGPFRLVLPKGYFGPSEFAQESYRVDGPDSQGRLNCIFLFFEPAPANSSIGSIISWKEQRVTAEGKNIVRREALIRNPGNIAERPSTEMLRVRVDASDSIEADQLCKAAEEIVAQAEKPRN
jgi:hypothetical protein